MGLVARESGALHSALNAFEYALALSPPDQQPVILDEIGSYYASTNDQHTALVYFQRALSLLQDDMRNVIKFKVELHCARAIVLRAYMSKRSSTMNSLAAICTPIMVFALLDCSTWD